MLTKLSKLSIKEIVYLVPAFILLLLSKLAIKILPFNFLQKQFQNLTKSHHKKLLSESEINLKVKSISRIAYRLSFLGFSCLPKAMAFKYWVKDNEYFRLHFGVQKDVKGHFVAHAWVTYMDSIILGEDPNVNFKSIWVWG